MADGPDRSRLFLQLMLRHHKGGFAMLRDAAQHVEEPELRDLAAQILVAQTADTSTFMMMLADRGAAPLPS